jgi:hypothetical protein
MFQDAAKYLEPTEVTRGLIQAGIDPDSAEGQSIQRAALDKRPEAVRTAEYATGGRADEPPAQRQSRDIVRRGLPDNRPDVVKLGEAAQDFPGILKSGVEAEAARKGADVTAASRATAFTREAEAATNAARMAQRLMPVLGEAETAFREAAKLGGTGPVAAGPVSRWLNARVPDLSIAGVPIGAPGHSAEIARQKFDSAIAAVRSAKTAVDLKGQGPVSNFERTLAAADLPDLESASPEIAYQAFNRLRQQLQSALELDQRLGLHAGEAGPKRGSAEPIQTPYGTLRERR